MTARELIKRFEGYRPRAYRCPAGLWTCGWGHTRGVAAETTCTEAQAEAWLDEDIAHAARALELFVSVPLSAGQREALLSFVFNLGAARFSGSTLSRKLNDGDTQGAADEFPKWVYGGGRKLPGLVTRRAAERELFLS